MKSYYFVLLVVAVSFTACQKVAPKPTTTVPAELLSKIIINTLGAPGYGKPLAEFNYNGHQISKAVFSYYNSNGTVQTTETTTFNYDSKGILTGTNTSRGEYSTITMTNGNISEIKYYLTGNVLNDDIVFTYLNGVLQSSTSPLSGAVPYSYNSSGNNTQGYGYGPFVNNSFDSANALTTALPNWLYFSYIKFSDSYDQGVPLNPGTHNVTSFTVDNGNGTKSSYSYTYQYDSDNFPSVSTSTVMNYYNMSTSPSTGAPFSFTYQYIPYN